MRCSTLPAPRRLLAWTRAGVALNVLARKANSDEELPRDGELDAGLRDVESVLPAVGR